ALAATVARLGIAASFRRATPGLWVGAQKLAAFGVHIRKGVAIHGFALNVTTALDAFDLIIPCGLPGVRATSLVALGAQPPPMPTLAVQVAAAFAGARGTQLEAVPPDAILSV